MIRVICVCVLFVALTKSLVAEKYLTKKPDFINPCKQTDPSFSQCFAKSFQAIYSEYKDGIPGLKNFGSIDPLSVKRVKIAEDGNGPVAINIEFNNMDVIGFSKTTIKDARFDQSKLTIKIKIYVPKIIIKSDYSMKGRILTLPLNGNGKSHLEMENMELDTICKLKRREEDGVKFADVDKVLMNIKVSGFHVQLDNLFNGQEVLEQTANNLFNDNWSELFEALRPSITETIRSVTEDRFKKVFAFLPVKYFIEDYE
uniref:Hemolymph juvenile hormone binding protein (JHBP) n=1 Tax=Musca domestica TaxID=7370 RepID=A0A1I8N7S0_MUSDO